VRDKLGSVALWLSEHNIDIKVIEVEVFKDAQGILMQPQVVVPLPVGRFTGVGKPKSGVSSKLWTIDGREWHLEKRCSPKTREMFLALNDIIADNFEVDGPRWNQKSYVAYRVGNFNWLRVETRPNHLVLNILVGTGKFSRSEVAATLGVEEFDEEGALGDKLGLPSSVNVRKLTGQTDRITLRLKDDFDISSEAFISFMNKSYKAFVR